LEGSKILKEKKKKKKEKEKKGGQVANFSPQLALMLAHNWLLFWPIVDQFFWPLWYSLKLRPISAHS
jgi:hypothetical protein